MISWYVHELVRKLHSEYTNKERSGIARIEKRDGYYEMTDIRFPKQSNHWAETEMKDWGLDELLEDIFTNTPEQLHEWKCWIHSHHHMWCFWSGTDEKAKRSFNDWATDYRWSVVTAYDKQNNPTYKCALNVFKPINVEFDIPVWHNEFDLEEYMKAFGQDYNSYLAEVQMLEQERDKIIQEAELQSEPKDSDIEKMVEIFNVEWTPEDKEVIRWLIISNQKESKKTARRKAEEFFEEHLEDLKEAYGIDYFSDKLKELEDNIIVPPVYRNKWNPTFGNGPWLFDTDPDMPPITPGGITDEDVDSLNDRYENRQKTKYKNNTNKPFTWLHWRDYGDY